MSFLDQARGVVGGLSSLVDEALPDVGDLGEKLCDAVLPSSYEWIGDMVSGTLNVATGNYAAAVGDLGDLVSDHPLTEPDPPGVAPVPTDLSAGTARVRADAMTVTTAEEGRGEAGPSTAARPDESAGMKAALSFTSMTPDQMLSRVRAGDIPPEIFESQSGMLMLQQRMGDIQRMNQLMTQLMQAIHDMQMAVVRNVRA